MEINRRDHFTPILASPHWLAIKSGIEFKTPLLTYKALNGRAPAYLKELMAAFCPSRALPSQTTGAAGDSLSFWEQIFQPQGSSAAVWKADAPQLRLPI